MKHLRAALLPLLAAIACIAATAPIKRGIWNTVVAVTPEGAHVIGNPQAPIKVTEYASYTCPHCAHFEVEGGAALQIAYIQSGKVSFELRNLVRDPIDLAAALLTNCGAPARFSQNHALFLRSQGVWLAAAQKATPAQQKRWNEGPLPARMRAIAGDLKFYDMMTRRGYDRVTSERCLTDQAMVQRLMAMRESSATVGVQGTPSFLINGALDDTIHDWKSLDAALKARLAAQ